MKVGIYCRVSKDKKGKDRSMAGQKEDGITFAEANGYTYEVFSEEEGKSGTLPISKRPEVFDLLNKIKSKEIDILFIYDLSRLERDLEEKFIIYNVVRQAKARLFSLRDGYLDFESPENMLYSNMMSIMNSYQVSLTKAKVKNTLLKNIIKGRVHSAPPYGYKSDDQKNLIINPETSVIVKRIFDLTIQGNGGATIAKLFSSEGIPTPTNHVGGEKLTYRTPNLKNKVTVVKSGLKWSPASITRLIKNTIYKGDRKWNDEIYKVAQIVTPEIFELAQNQIQRNKNNSTNNTKHNYLLKGKLICAICGSNYHGYTQSKRNISVYKCYSGRIVNQDIECKNKRITTNIIEDLIWQRVIGNTLLLKVLKADFDFNNVDETYIELISRIKSLNNQLNQIDSSRSKAINLCTKDFITESDLEIQINEFTRERKQIEKQLQELESQKSISENQNNILDEVEKFQERLRHFENLDFKTKKKLVDVFIDKVRIGYNTIDKLTEIEINLKLNEEYFSFNEKLSIDLSPLVTHPTPSIYHGKTSSNTSVTHPPKLL